MKTRKTRLKTKRVTCYNAYNGVYFKWVTKIQVRIMWMWWTLSVVIDEDETYSIERAREINDYLDEN